MPVHRLRRRVGAFEIAACGLLAAAALVFGYVEALFPLPVPVPGIKLGLGNVAVLCTLVVFGARQGLLVMLVKVGVSALLFGNLAVFAYSLGGALASFAAMLAALRVRALSVVGVSMVGGVFHMLGQLAVVAAVFTPAIALTYLPVLLVAGVASGALTGVVAHLMVRAFGRSAAFARWRRDCERAQKALAAKKPVSGREAAEAPAEKPAPRAGTASAEGPAPAPAPAPSTVAAPEPTTAQPGAACAPHQEEDPR